MRILCLEDHADTLAVLCRLLQRSGYLVFAAGSIAEARKTCLRENIDLLLCDLQLPDGNACDLARELLRDCHIRHAIAVTAHGQPADRHATLEAGFDAHLVKPIIFTELLGRIQALDAS